MIIFLVVGIIFLLTFIYSSLVVAKKADEYIDKQEKNKRVKR